MKQHSKTKPVTPSPDPASGIGHWKQNLEFGDMTPTSAQKAIINTEARELLIVGARGGGKTTSLFFAASLYLHEPQYRALIVMQHIHGYHLDYWFKLGGKLVGGSRGFKFPSGAIVDLDDKLDQFDLLAPQYDYIGIDFYDLSLGDSEHIYANGRANILKAPPSHNPRIQMTAEDAKGWVYEYFVDNDDPNRTYRLMRSHPNPLL